MVVARLLSVHSHLDEGVDVAAREAEHDDVGPGREAGPDGLAGRWRLGEAGVGGLLALVGHLGLGRVQPQLGVQSRRQGGAPGYGVCSEGDDAI